MTYTHTCISACMYGQSSDLPTWNQSHTEARARLLDLWFSVCVNMQSMQGNPSLGLVKEMLLTHYTISTVSLWNYIYICSKHATTTYTYLVTQDVLPFQLLWNYWKPNFQTVLWASYTHSHQLWCIFVIANTDRTAALVWVTFSIAIPNTWHPGAVYRTDPGQVTSPVKIESKNSKETKITTLQFGIILGMGAICMNESNEYFISK